LRMIVTRNLTRLEKESYRSRRVMVWPKERNKSYRRKERTRKMMKLERLFRSHRTCLFKEGDPLLSIANRLFSRLARTPPDEAGNLLAYFNRLERTESSLSAVSLALQLLPPLPPLSLLRLDREHLLELVPAYRPSLPLLLSFLNKRRVRVKLESSWTS